MNIYLLLFLEFLKIGLFTFGGGYAMIPLVKEVVTSHGWMMEEEFTKMIGVAEMTPGPIALNMATFVGNQQGGVLGAILATLGVVLPAFIIMLIIAIVLKKIINNKKVQGALTGIKPVAIALILTAGLILLRDIIFPISSSGLTMTNKNLYSLLMMVIILINFALLRKVFNKKINPFVIIITSGLIGIAVNYIIPLS